MTSKHEPPVGHQWSPAEQAWIERQQAAASDKSQSSESHGENEDSSLPSDPEPSRRDTDGEVLQ